MYICIQYEYNMYIQYNYFISENLRTPLMYLCLPFLPPQTPQLKKHFKTLFSFLTFSLFHFLSSCAWTAHHFGRITTSTSLGRSCLGCLPDSGPALRIPSPAQAQASGRCRAPPQETVGGHWKQRTGGVVSPRSLLACSEFRSPG